MSCRRKHDSTNLPVGICLRQPLHQRGADGTGCGSLRRIVDGQDGDVTVAFEGDGHIGSIGNDGDRLDLDQRFVLDKT